MIINHILNRNIVCACKRFISQVTINCNWHLEHLTERTILKLNGEKCSEFLQGLITNDVNLLNNQKSIFAMFLNSKGRTLFDAIIYNTDNENSLLIECDVGCVENLEKHLKMYKVRRKIDFIRDEYAIWVVFNSQIDQSQMNDFKLELGEKCLICPDPRVSNLGYRVVVPQDAKLVNNIKGNSDISYKMLRYKLGIAEGAVELPVGKCFPLEINGDYLNGISFNKGCYIGQELTARIHHTGVVRKRLMPFSFENQPENVNIDDPIMLMDNTNTTSIGKLRGMFGKFGLGVMRMKEAVNARELKVGNYSIQCSKPLWWPLTSEEYTKKKLA